MPCLCWSDFRFWYTTLEDWSFLILGGPTVAGWCRPFFVNLQPSYVASFAWVHLQVFTEILWCPFLTISKAGVMIPPLCVNLQILRTLELPVCLFVPRLIDQFTKIYDPPFGSIYRELWWPICHNLQSFFNPLVVLQIEDLRTGCSNILSRFCLSPRFIYYWQNFFFSPEAIPLYKMYVKRIYKYFFIKAG